MLIGDEPSQRVFRSRRGGDKLLVLDTKDQSVRLYVTVETLLRPTTMEVVRQQHQPFVWEEATGMMRVLREVGCRNYAEIEGEDEAEQIMAELEQGVG